MVRKKIGEILLEQGAITEQQLQEATKEKGKTGALIGQVLLKKGYINKKQLANALAAQMEVPVVEKVTEKMADPDTLGKIPLKFLRQHIVVPIILDGKKIILTANPRDLQPIDDLSLMVKDTQGYAVATENTIIAIVESGVLDG